MGFYNFYLLTKIIKNIQSFFYRLKPYRLALFCVLLVGIVLLLGNISLGYSSSDNYSNNPLSYDDVLPSSNDIAITNLNVLPVNPVVTNFVNHVTSNSLYLTGDYYYFISYSLNRNYMYCVLMPKSILDNRINNIKFKVGSYPLQTIGSATRVPVLAYLDFGFNFQTELSDSCYICYSSYDSSSNKWGSYTTFRLFNTTNNYWTSQYFTTYNGNGFASYFPYITSFFSGAVMYSNVDHLAQICFATDIPYQFTFDYSGDTRVLWAGQTPYIANTTAELQGLTSDTLNLVTLGYEDFQLSLVDNTENTTLFTIDTSSELYSQYYRRLDLDDPFSDLAYMIPWSALPTFNYTNGHQFDFKLSYMVNSTGPYVIHHYVTSSYTGSPVGGGNSPSTGGGGGSDPDPSVTGEDIDKLGDRIESSIESSTDRILSDDLDESSMDIDTSTFSDIDNTSVFDLFYKMTDIIVASLVPSKDVYEITIPVSQKYGGEIVLRSDIVSSYLPQNAFIYILINGFWFFIFGRYMWQIAFNVLQSVKTGDILDGKLSVADVITDELL